LVRQLTGRRHKDNQIKNEIENENENDTETETVSENDNDGVYFYKVFN